MFRNAPIRTKLIVALLGPLLLLAVLALVGIRQNLAESDRAERSTAFARLAAGLAPLIHQLQAERSLSISYIDSGRRQWGPELLEQRRVVDQAAATYRAEAQRLSAGDELLAEKIEYGLSELGRLGEQRQTIDDAKIVASELKVEPGIELHEEEGEEELEHATEEGHGPLTLRARRSTSTPTPSATCSTSTARSPPAPTTPRCSRVSPPRSPWPGPRTSPTPSAACSRTSTPRDRFGDERAGQAQPPWSPPRSSTRPSSTPTPPRPSTSSSRRPSPGRRSSRSTSSSRRPWGAPATQGSTPTRRPGSAP